MIWRLLAHRERGDISVYAALVITTIMLLGALVLASILSQQIGSTEDALSSERAFYAAVAGAEELKYLLNHSPFNPYEEVNGVVPYQFGVRDGTYEGCGYREYDPDEDEDVENILAAAEFDDEQRKIRELSTRDLRDVATDCVDPEI